MTSTMILAAGRGTRLQELTADTPKPLVEVAGVQPLRRTLQLLAYRGYTQTVINAWYLAHLIKQMADDVKNPMVKVVEEPQLLDTGGGVKNALPYMDGGPVLIMNGDLIWSEETHPILAQIPDLFDPETMDGLLLLIPTNKAEGYNGSGDFFRQEDGRLRQRTAQDGEAPYVYSGIQVLHPRVFDGIQSNVFPLIDVYNKLADAGRLYGHVYDGEWADMGTPEGMRAAGKLLGRLGSSKVA